ncbi:hypothetical protein N5U17_10050 [Aliarcobacter butzleri]|uniref:hypothetical protein n=1 Tax=Aliarcobacter butzleri TaxID=28197 RepID=UPI0021B216E5|nr:hypothetical protein [Aliarcobacter butzleri]MCT7604576.1 hypothetical protein [Aliarcobacter butzleri]
MNFFTVRLDLSESEFEMLKSYIDFEKMKEAEKRFNKNEAYYKSMNITESLESQLLQKINNPKKIKYSFKKVVATREATEKRSQNAKEKIQNAINILRLENKKISHYSISQVAEVSFVTAKKYISDDVLKKLNS